MASGHKYPFPGGDTGELTLDATTTTQYTDPILIPHGSVFAFQKVYTTAGADLTTSTAQMQETCIPNPGLSDDTDWVASTDVTIAAADGTDGAKELINVGNLGSGLIRFKFVRSAGSGSVRIYYSIKKNI